jgi:polysaccharide biosynthesis/export protein
MTMCIKPLSVRGIQSAMPNEHSNARLRGRRRVGIAISLCCLIAICSGCSSSAQNETAEAGGTQAAMSPEQCAANGQIVQAAQQDNRYIIQRGDSISITSYLNTEFNQDATVRPDGQVSLMLIGSVPAAGLTPQQLADELNKDYSSELRNPDISVSLKNMPSREIYVEGEVQKPGGFSLDPGMTLLQAVADAGGLTDNAGNKAVLIRRDACGVARGMPIDLKAATKNPDSGEDVALETRDIVVVPKSGIANLDKWMNQYVREMLPVNPYIAADAPLAF